MGGLKTTTMKKGVVFLFHLFLDLIHDHSLTIFMFTTSNSSSDAFDWNDDEGSIVVVNDDVSAACSDYLQKQVLTSKEAISDDAFDLHFWMPKIWE